MICLGNKPTTLVCDLKDLLKISKTVQQIHAFESRFRRLCTWSSQQTLNDIVRMR